MMFNMGGQADPSRARAAPPPIVAKCKADLAKRLKVPAKTINVSDTQPATWPDTALGMPGIGKMYAQVLTPGFRVILQAKGSQYLYTASAKAFKYGGPVSIWSCSMLYIKEVPDEPDLNGDLYQCSLMGTNSVLLVPKVTDYYPQGKGVVIVKRRTSRSSHELLYVKAGDAANVKTLYSAFDFGDAAMNSVQDKWAGFVRPSVGAAWNVVVAGIGQNTNNAQTLPLPDGFKPDRIAWSGEMLFILGKKEEQPVCFETSLKAGESEWKEVGSYIFPGLTEFMLNKSETLEIDQVTENGKPGVEVALVWFTGDRNVVAKISDITLSGYDLVGGYAFIWGEKGSKSAAYAVNIRTSEIISGFIGAGRNIKPFSYPPQRNPMVLEKSK